MSSFSWVTEKSSGELASLLKNAYMSLREKERDLALAAEIGKSLLENNMTLNSKYQGMLKRIQQYEKDNQDNHDCWQDNDDCYSDKSAAMYLISHQRAREALIEELEIKNAEMKKMLDNALYKSTENSHNNEKTTRKLQNEIEILRSNLDIAAQKIQQLEELRYAQKYNECSNESVDVLLSNMQDREETEELNAKIVEMQTKNEQLTTAKHVVEHKLQNTLMDLQDLRQQLAQFQYNQQEYISLKEAYQRQFKHIEELTISLEDHRNTLSHLRECGIGWSPPIPNSLQMDLSMTTPKQSLLYELENEWLKRLQKPALSESLHDHTACLTEHNLASLYNASSEYALENILPCASFKERFIQHMTGVTSTTQKDIEVSSIREDNSTFSTYNLYPRVPPDFLISFDCRCSNHGVKHTKNLDPSPSGQYPCTLIGLIYWVIQCAFGVIWRWCRFTLVLFTAIVINLWHGPDAVLEK
ncbi:hypothetical protein K492DRAFT_137935 [Lichtheimia hyalospora FSU 10163]|nr:hypothetical protein K492DRAFT_137935 [Lichtheimia hyalospora FSU 10163]